MKRIPAMPVSILLLLCSLSFAELQLSFYYGYGSQPCGNAFNMLVGLAREYNMSIEGRDVYNVPYNRAELVGIFQKYGVLPWDQGVPVTIVENRTMVVGEISRAQWEEILSACQSGACREGVYSEGSFSSIDKGGADPKAKLYAAVIAVLAGAGIVAIFYYKRRTAQNAG